MRFGVLGTGIVGQTLAGKLVALGHEVKMGSREAGNEKAVAWAAEAGEGASEGSFADAAGFGEVVINATSGAHSLEALAAAGAESLSGKVLIDVANPLDPGPGLPTVMATDNDSLAEQIQRAFPDARVVKTLNTVTAGVMVEPSIVPGSHSIFVCGNDAGAKAHVTHMLENFGWPEEDVIDLGEISAARGAEMYVGLWLRLMGTLGTPRFNISVVRGD